LCIHGAHVELRKKERTLVSGTAKAKNKAQDLGGKAKAAVGNVTGDERTRNEGKGRPGQGQSQRPW
jgi:uncharacterized protein YjbJ (UPF0337 family)